MPRPKVPVPLQVIAVIFGLLVLATFTWLAAVFSLILPLWYCVSHHLYENLTGWLGDIACSWTFPTFQKYSKLEIFLFGQSIVFPQKSEKSIIMFNHQSWYIYLYIYIHFILIREREREKNRKKHNNNNNTKQNKTKQNN